MNLQKQILKLCDAVEESASDRLAGNFFKRGTPAADKEIQLARQDRQLAKDVRRAILSLSAEVVAALEGRD